MRKNSNKAILSYTAQWDIGFQCGMNDGYKQLAKSYANSSSGYERGYDTGYNLGAFKAKKENANSATYAKVNNAFYVFSSST
jgi:hypothetical protein